MSKEEHVTLLREIRDRIGRDVENMPWDQWHRRIREEVSPHPGLARMLDRAIKPANLSRSASRK